ncbi:methyltransferase domain-containing protein [Paenibacillus rhizovicinus]|uniref:Methyltransferase domain-containing protein n=1 Tax=Paenibacillus rhizovicinus TaxID=2704463 RepID=A0A6C0P4U5_9BACL|nr:class I SAM-dependent methyltransferase [Paenibacillus rhizovicinus]QHW33276.1 methyltransferase domain-containing protein [Paenibacillus rhizovicinus]
MGFLSVLGMAQRLVKERVAPGGVVIDATCGNGVDTQFLAELVGPRGRVYAFDIQVDALERTRARLAALADAGASRIGGTTVQAGQAATAAETNNSAAVNGSRIDGSAGRDAVSGGNSARQAAAAPGPLRLVHASHAEMDKHLAAEDRGAVAAVMFNLGYLPGANTDQAVITEPASTLAALENALTLLRPGGLITAVLYPGHPGGFEEAEAVAGWASSLPQPTGQAMLYRMVQKAEAPYLIAIEKK